MNNLNRTNSIPLAQSPTGSFDPVTLFPEGAVIDVIAPVRQWTLEWAGHIRCSLGLSIGEIKLRANRSTLPLSIGAGTWVHAKLMRRQGDELHMHVIGAVATAPAPGTTSWVPGCAYHRMAAMRDLRGLLSTLDPALQGLFMSAMADVQTQRGYFWRPSAADHHCYPGGLFDHSVASAKAAHQGVYASDHDRGLATMASLLFDIGKVTEWRLQVDRLRTGPPLQLHPATVSCLERSLACLAQSLPALAAELGALLAPQGSAPTPRMAALRTQVHRSVVKSWGPAESFLTVPVNPGAKA